MTLYRKIVRRHHQLMAEMNRNNPQSAIQNPQSVCHPIQELQATGIVQAVTSTRRGGVSDAPYHSLNLGAHVGDNPQAVTENRRIFFDQIGLKPQRLICCRQIHSDTVIHINRSDISRKTPPAEADAMITTHADLPLGIFTADCVPVFILDPVTPAIGLAHAGWRGTLACIAAKTVQSMECHFQTSAADCLVHLGSSIQQCCYTVSEALADRFEEVFGNCVRTEAHALSLQNANVRQLTQVGVRPEAISASAFCTACRTDIFYSHRAENGQTGRMLSLIKLSSFR
jgi:polyphenol oxidase